MFLKVILKRVSFVMALVSIRMRTKFCFENSSKRCRVFLKVILKRVFFVMALVSVRTRAKCCLLKVFQN